MPLKPGKSHEVIKHNIKEMIKAGHPVKQAIAASLAHSRKYSSGGEVDGDEDTSLPEEMMHGEYKPWEVADPETVPNYDEGGEVHHFSAVDPSPTPTPSEPPPQEGSIAAVLRKAFGHSDGGEVDEEPDFDWSKSGEQRLLPPKTETPDTETENLAMGGPVKEHGLSPEMLEAIKAKKAKRRHGFPS